MKTANTFSSTPNETNSSSVLTRALRFIARGPARTGALLLSLVALSTPNAWAQPFSIWNDATVPGTPADSDPNSVALGLRFRSAIDGQITAIRFYKGAGNTGPHVGALWANDGTLLASVVFDAETDSGWQQQALTSPVPINSNTTYVVSYHAPVGHYAVDLDFFSVTGVDNFPLRALANGEDGPNGVYAYGGSGAFPNQTFRSANYWVDVVLAPAGAGCPGDTTPPTIVAPRDVILQCADCNTDPANTGTATATDDCGVTITYRDVVSGTCPQVVKRTWTATDDAGNTARALQTITCLPASLVTDSAGCIFDRDSSTEVQDFRLIFVQDPQNWPNYKLPASNPGQFFYNVFLSGTAGQQITFNITLPYPFVTHGATPIHAYDWVNVTTHDGEQCLTPGNSVFASSQLVKLSSYGRPPAATTTLPVTLTIPSSGFVYLTIHLGYGLRGTTGYTRNAADDAVGANVVIANNGTYTFSVGGAQTGSASIVGHNAFKRIPGVAGLVSFTGTGNPIPGTTVNMATANSTVVASGVADEDGFYMLAYKHTGKASNYYLSFAVPPPDTYTGTKTIKLKANAFVLVDFPVSGP